MAKFESCGRSMRWYDWLAGLLLLALACGVRAESVYKCTDGRGGIAYQGHACAPAQDGVEIAIAPAPPHAASPQYALREATPEKTQHAARATAARRAASTETSYECRVANGDVFYRHAPCPHSIAASDERHTGKGGSKDRRDGASRLSVSSHPVSREEACAQIHRAGAIGRNGHEHDDTVSTYDRNLGRDPCH